MSPISKREYLNITKVRYHKASLTKKTRILDEFTATYSCHRKHAIRLLNTPLVIISKPYKRRGKPPTYRNLIIKKVLEKIWLGVNLPCSKRLKAAIPLWIDSYQQNFETLSDTILNLLLKISASTIDRILRPLRVKYTRRGRSTTKPGTLLRKQIPIKTDQWNEFRPGFLEADTVAHCGTSVSGSFVNTLDLVDIATGWTEQRATWGKAEHEVVQQIHDIELSLPFSILGFDSDNGSEFLNHHLLRYFRHRKFPIQFTRSRPYHKNDNAHIEQKNWTHVRQFLGYERFDNPKIVPLLNALYKSEWRFYHNFFCPSTKLISKQRLGSKTIKRYDTPKTPFQRILESSYIDPSVKKNLSELFQTLDPFKLHQSIRLKIKAIFSIL